MDILIEHGTINIQLHHVIQMISQQRYNEYYNSLTSIYDKNIEDDKNHGVPIMSKSFYLLFLKLKRIPSWQEFLEAYKRQWCKSVPNGMTFTLNNPRYQYIFQEKALDKKLIRAYMSFLKEVYVLYWLYDKGLTSSYYSFDNDMAGFDITVRNQFGNTFGIKIYANTYNANKFALIKKNTRNKLPENSTGIAIKTAFSDEYRIGDTYVFSDKLLNAVYHYINNNIQKDIVIEEVA